MAVLNFGKLDLYAGVTEDFPFTATLFESDGVTEAELAADDVVVCVLSSRDKGEPTEALLTIDSDTPTANDSEVVIEELGDADTGDPAVGYVRFAEADTAELVADWAAGVTQMLLMCELWYIDNSETDPADAKKLIARGEILLHRTGAL